jgi:hypothetical protein
MVLRMRESPVDDELPRLLSTSYASLIGYIYQIVTKQAAALDTGDAP